MSEARRLPQPPGSISGLKDLKNYLSELLRSAWRQESFLEARDELRKAAYSTGYAEKLILLYNGEMNTQGRSARDVAKEIAAATIKPKYSELWNK